MNKQLHQLSVLEVLEGLQKGEFTSVELVEHYLERIKKYNLELNAYLYVNEKALEQAAVADQERRSGSKKKLLGLPIAIKDNFLTKGMVTTASSVVLDGFTPPFGSTVTERLSNEGAIILGKTNLDAWAHGSSTETSQYGRTLNPWNLEHLPGGSSGGSAAVVAAQLAPITIGSETAGSIRQPAAWCGITGVKPTYGRVSRYGVVSMASSTDSPGPMGRNIEDCALILSVIAGKDKNDATTSNEDVPAYHEKLLRQDLSGIKVGLVNEYLLPTMDEKVKTLIRDAAKKMEELGAEVGSVSLMDPKYSIGVYTVLQRSEVSANLARYDGVRFGSNRDKFGEEAKRRIMLGTYTLSAGYYDAFYKKAMAVRTKIVEDFDMAFKKFDVVIGPVSPGPALRIGASLDKPMFGEMEDMLVEPSSIAGLPGVGVPCGFVDGLPIGLQITGPLFSEEKVLNIANIYQKNTDFVKFPEKYD